MILISSSVSSYRLYTPLSTPETTGRAVSWFVGAHCLTMVQFGFVRPDRSDGSFARQMTAGFVYLFRDVVIFSLGALFALVILGRIMRIVRRLMIPADGDIR
jgi:hypothetical protein